MDYNALEEENFRLEAYVRRLERIKDAATRALKDCSSENINSLRQAVEGEALLTEAMGFPVAPSLAPTVDQDVIRLLTQYGVPTDGLTSVEVEISVNQIPTASVTRHVMSNTYPLLEGTKVGPGDLIEVQEVFQLFTPGKAGIVSQSATVLTRQIWVHP